jgi:hypothetical protein
VSFCEREIYCENTVGIACAIHHRLNASIGTNADRYHITFIMDPNDPILHYDGACMMVDPIPIVKRYWSKMELDILTTTDGTSCYERPLLQ